MSSYQDSAVRNLGYDEQLPHDVRHDRADEYMQVIYKFFEGSFEPDRARGRVVHGAGYVRAHPGRRARPILLKAGAPARGEEFSPDHAEAIFFAGSTPQLVPRWIDRVHVGLLERGRPADAVKILTIATVIVAITDEEARARGSRTSGSTSKAGARSRTSAAGRVSTSRGSTLMRRSSTCNRGEPLGARVVHDPYDRPHLNDARPRRVRRDRANGQVIVGSPTTVVDELERSREESGGDGFNVTAAERPPDFERFVDLVTRELPRRGLLPEAGVESHGSRCVRR